MRRLMFCLLVIVSVAMCADDIAAVTTVNDVIQTVRDRNIAFDTVRFPGALILRLCKDVQSLVVSTGNPIQAETTYAVTTKIRYRLPVRYSLFLSLILNADPTKTTGMSNHEVALQYVPPEDWGKEPVPAYDRPYQWTVFGDSLALNVGRSEVSDSIRFLYFRKARELTAVTDTLDIPDRFIPLLKEYVLQYCYDRVTFNVPAREDTEARLKFFEQQILGRPTDEK